MKTCLTCRVEYKGAYMLCKNCIAKFKTDPASLRKPVIDRPRLLGNDSLTGGGGGISVECALSAGK